MAINYHFVIAKATSYFSILEIPLCLGSEDLFLPLPIPARSGTNYTLYIKQVKLPHSLNIFYLK